MTFSKRIFAEVQPLLEKIYTHPFNKTLAAGTLEKDKFIFYLQQDSLYLIDYARALALMGARCMDPKHIDMFLRFSHGALEGERTLHLNYFKEYGIHSRDAALMPKSPACMAYSAYLVERAATADLSEAMAALLPCFWIYREVGNYIFKQAQQPNPYWNWIETYASEEFSAIVDEAIDFTDQLAEDAGSATLIRMHSAFMESSGLEYCFWDDAYHCRTWSY